MPEKMPTPKKSLKELEKEKKQLEIKEQKKIGIINHNWGKQIEY